jgi:hypothetical protein
MPPQDAPIERDEYRLILVRSGSNAIWTERDENPMRLPRVVVLKRGRPAEQLQDVVKAAWNMRVIILDFLHVRESFQPCAVAEIVSPESHLRLTATQVDDMPTEEINLEEREMLRASFDDGAHVHGPFSRVGWIKEAIEWIQAEVGQDVSFTEEIRQYNAGGRFALVRFGTTSGPALWLKATGEPNAHEFHVTRKLVDLCPEFVPLQIAAREDWNAWLMEEAGQPLESWALPDLEQAALTLAALQMKTSERRSDFLSAGAFDQRVSTLRANLAEVIEYLDEAMAKQSSTRVPRIDRERLRQMKDILRDACLCMEELEIPDTLVHNDINSGNILFQGTRCVFTDWCEVGVGNPFFAFQYLSKLQPSRNESWTPRLRDAYGRCWLGLLNESQIERAFALTPLLAIFSYLFGRGDWLHSAQRSDPCVERHARSLARHMDRAALEPGLKEAICR